MINMQKRDWESIYRQRGDLKFRVLSKIVRASRLFETRNYKKILDVGCGTGKHSIYLAKKGFSVYATDISPTGIDIARRKARSLSLTNIHFKQHDMVTIPFVDGFFDAVVCTWAIYHGALEQIQKTVSEIYRVLKPDGTVVTDFLSVLTESYRSGREIEKNTFIGDKYQEEDVPHHYATREELTQLFSEFRQLKIHLSSKIYIGEQGEKHFSKRYNVQAIK